MTFVAWLAPLAALVAALLAWRLHVVEKAHSLQVEKLRADAAERERLAREQTAAAERERILSDLHDDLGAGLLGLIYRAESPQQADRARALLQNLRDVVTRARGTPGTLGDVLADIRGEAQARLAAVGIELEWSAPDELPDPRLDHARALHLYRIVREAISNAIRHAQAKRLRIRLRHAGDRLHLDVTDDGPGTNAAVAGVGMRGMQARAAELSGAIAWSPGTEGGTKVLLTLPLDGLKEDGA